MFTLFGAMLVIFGAVSNTEIYETHSLDININLLWGAGAAGLRRGHAVPDLARQPQARPASDQNKRRDR